jgi:hypothetical protein
MIIMKNPERLIIYTKSDNRVQASLPESIKDIHTGRITINVIPRISGSESDISAPTIQNILVGNAVDIDVDGYVVKANNNCVGIAISVINNICTYASDGIVERSNWMSVADSDNLIPGAYYYMSLDGKISTVRRTDISKQIGVAVSQTKLDIEMGQRYILSPP